MTTLSLNGVGPRQREAATWSAAVLTALAREERAGRRPLCVLDPGHRTWQRFRGRLGLRDLLEIALEDAAVVQPVPYRFEDVLPDAAHPRRLPADLVDHWFAELADQPLDEPGPDYVMEQARLLGIPTRLGRTSLHRVKGHLKVLELPGTGGQLTHHMAVTQPELFAQDVFTIACDDWRQWTLAGIIATDLGVGADLDIRLTDDLQLLAQGYYPIIVGLDPDKGGRFERGDIARIFQASNPTVLLV